MARGGSRSSGCFAPNPTRGFMKMNRIMQKLTAIGMALVSSTACGEAQARRPTGAPTPVAVSNDGELEVGLVGHWKLQSDCRDYSGRGNHGVNHGVGLKNGAFDGVGAYIEVPVHPSLNLGTGDFTVCARIYTEREVNDVLGDVLDKYDPDLRRGITLSLKSSAGGYQSQGTDRHVCFGIDNARMNEWMDCGRPSRTSNYVSNSLTVLQGKLYAATIDAKDKRDWRHVFRYEGQDRWTDCGQVGTGQSTGVGPLIVHQGNLYAVTTTYDWTRVQTGPYEPGL